MTEFSTYTDRALLELVRSGNHEAFSAIYHRYKRQLFLHAYQRLRNMAEVEDLIHELFTALWVRREDLTINTNLSAYLFTAVKNKIIDLVAHKKVESGYINNFAMYLSQTVDMTDHLLREKLLAEQIAQVVASLPPKMREVFELSRHANLSHQEIADQLGITKKTVKNQINSALKIIRARLTDAAFVFVLLFY